LVPTEELRPNLMDIMNLPISAPAISGSTRNCIGRDQCSLETDEHQARAMVRKNGEVTE